MTIKIDQMTSSKPYLIRAIYDWILDNEMTPHLVVDANYPMTFVPKEFVEDGRIVLNISPNAVRGLVVGNDQIEFSARFGGVVREIVVPTDAVVGIFTRENGQGMVFPDPQYPVAPGAEGDETASSPERQMGPTAVPSAPSSGTSQSGAKGKGKGGPTLKLIK